MISLTQLAATVYEKICFTLSNYTKRWSRIPQHWNREPAMCKPRVTKPRWDNNADNFNISDQRHIRALRPRYVEQFLQYTKTIFLMFNCLEVYNPRCEGALLFSTDK